MSQTQWAKENKDRVKVLAKRYYDKNKEKIAERKRLSYLQNPENKKEYSRKYEKQNREKLNNQLNLKKAKYRLEALQHYSGENPKCSECGYDKIEALAIDHINNDGSKHRKQINGRDLAWWLRSNNYPKDFQVLCHNCNWIKHIKDKKSTKIIKELYENSKPNK